MKSSSPDPFNPRIVGFSALGNNQIEGTDDGHAPVTETEAREVPLVFDTITGTWCAKLSKTNQEDREVGLEVARLTNEDQSFLARIGYTQS